MKTFCLEGQMYSMFEKSKLSS